MPLGVPTSIKGGKEGQLQLRDTDLQSNKINTMKFLTSYIFLLFAVLAVAAPMADPSVHPENCRCAGGDCEGAGCPYSY